MDSTRPADPAIELPGHIVSPSPHRAASVLEDEFMEAYLWHVNQYINDHVRFSDTKAGSVIVLSGAVLGLMYSGNLQHAFTQRAPAAWGVAGFGAVAALLLLAASIFCAAWSMRPRLIRSHPTGFVFWEGIRAHGSPQAFVHALNEQGRSALLDHLGIQIYHVSTICSTKFRWVGRAIALALAGALCAGLVLLLR
jgi:hypothetical protein